MHYLAFVVIPPDGDPNEHVNKALAPFEEETHDGWWDWYQIGGRWTGHFDGYDPDSDPENQEVCTICNGTGRGDWTGCNVPEGWAEKCNGCNGCSGTGMQTKWPTQRSQREGDIAPVCVALAKTLEGQGPHTLVAGETVLLREQYIWDETLNTGDFVQNSDFDATVAETLTAADPAWRVAIVDYHC